MADFRREYRVTDVELATWGTADFVTHLIGLSDQSRFRLAVADDGPAELSEEQAARALGLR